MLLIASCNKDKASNVTGDWLFPIAKGNLSINSLSQLKNLNYTINIPAQSIGQPVNIPVSSPGLQLDHVGPFPVEITDWLHRLDVDTLEFSGSLNNIFPIPIGAGTVVTMRTSRDTGISNIAGTAVVSSTILPNQAFSFDIQVNKKTLGDSVYFFLDHFNSPAYNNLVFATSPTVLKIKLKIITASYAEVYTNKTFSSVDTADFSAGSTDNIGSRTNGTLSDTSTSGIINVFTDNGLPANVQGQLYFLDDSKTQVIDSLFVSQLKIGGGLTNSAGTTSFTNSQSTQITVNRLKLNHISAAKYVVSHFSFNTIGFTGPYVSVNTSAYLGIQFTGDLNIRINF